MSSIPRLALYTTVYPEAAQYLSAWLKSVDAQLDRDFDLVIGVDGMDLDDVHRAAGQVMRATWVVATPTDTPASLRGRAIEQMVVDYPALVFVDSDDLLLPRRVAEAREQLASAEVVACALDLVDEADQPLGIRMPGSSPTALEARMPLANVFGLSNTAYASRVLAHCLPVPPECILVDWYLATRALLAGGRLAFDSRVGMRYRQHPRNVAKLLKPSGVELQRASQLVLQHLTLVLQDGFSPQDARRVAWERRRDEVASFARMLEYPARAEAYLGAMNEIELERNWWETVAHPKLEALWR